MSGESVVVYQLHECDVCRLVDKDTSQKDCTYCTICKAWICRTCHDDVWRRGQAVAKGLVGLKKTLPSEPKNKI